ncbi:MAG: hypothetical protein GF390_01630, partial [Candidatus Pacebacteria bacterium]|nr:hypothetical protein [Candidatus Paceibacterota bacterium]
HMTVPQIKGMYRGDQARKQTLIEYGFRLPSAIDNRPLKFPEFLRRNDQLVYVSATPADWEISQASGEVVEQLIRPTGLVDPQVEVRPVKNQIPDLIKEIVKRKQQKQRVLVTTLTKRMAEALTDYLNNEKKLRQLIKQAYAQKTDQDHKVINKQLTDLQLPQVAYLHSDIETLERSEILADLRKGKYDVLVGINLLREGLDLPEVSLVAILDADKAGFLRSTTSLIQTMGRAARHVNGLAILYANQPTKAMRQAIEETARRRQIQLQYNHTHQITPTTITKAIKKPLLVRETPNKPYQTTSNKAQKPTKPLIIKLTKKESLDINKIDPQALTPQDKKKLTVKLQRRMTQAANELDFELAAILRDKIKLLNN